MSATSTQPALPDVAGGSAPLEYMMSLAEVEAITKRKKSWIYREVRAKRFPAPDDGSWYASEIQTYLRKRRDARLRDGGENGG